MAESTELEKRLERLEADRGKRWGPWAQTLISPAILLFIGWWLNAQIEDSKQALQKAELDLRRIEAVQDMLQQLFSGKPEQAFVTERLLKQIVERELADEISRVVAQYYKGELDSLASGGERVTEQQVQAIQQITESARRIGTDSYQEIAKAALSHVVVESIKIDGPDSRARAVRSAEALRAKGYDGAAVWTSRTGYYGVVIGRLPVVEADALKQRAVDAGDAPPDAYLHSGSRFIEQVWP